MNKTRHRTAVGAGTTAGEAIDEELAPESRAAEAEVDGMLESLRVTGAAPRGILPDNARQPPAGSRGDVAPADPATLHPERPHADLAHNEAGVAGRVEDRR
jgi:hypothetical protein